MDRKLCEKELEKLKKMFPIDNKDKAYIFIRGSLDTYKSMKKDIQNQALQNKFSCYIFLFAELLNGKSEEEIKKFIRSLSLENMGFGLITKKSTEPELYLGQIEVENYARNFIYGLERMLENDDVEGLIKENIIKQHIPTYLEHTLNQKTNLGRC